jgi:hypothetical protein
LPVGRRASGFVLVGKGLPTSDVRHPIEWWRAWWAHHQFSRINIALIIRNNQIEEYRDFVKGVVVLSPLM